MGRRVLLHGVVMATCLSGVVCVPHYHTAPLRLRGAPVAAAAARPDEESEYGPGEPPAAFLRALRPFPPRAVVQSWCRFQRAHGGHLERLLALRRRDPVLWEAAEDQWRRYQAWHLLEQAHDPCASVAHRGECLEKLRDVVGAEASGTGRMPEPVAWWTFDRVD